MILSLSKDFRIQSGLNGSTGSPSRTKSRGKPFNKLRVNERKIEANKKLQSLLSLKHNLIYFIIKQTMKNFKPLVYLIIIAIIIITAVIFIKPLLLKTPLADTYCSSSETIGECLKKGCIAVEIGFSSDPRVLNSPWCRPP